MFTASFSLGTKIGSAYDCMGLSRAQTPFVVILIPLCGAASMLGDSRVRPVCKMMRAEAEFVYFYANKL